MRAASVWSMLVGTTLEVPKCGPRFKVIVEEASSRVEGSIAAEKGQNINI